LIQLICSDFSISLLAIALRTSLYVAAKTSSNFDNSGSAHIAFSFNVDALLQLKLAAFAKVTKDTVQQKTIMGKTQVKLKFTIKKFANLFIFKTYPVNNKIVKIITDFCQEDL